MAETHEVPKKGKAGVVMKGGTPEAYIEVQEVDVPEPKADQLLIKLNCTGLCMSDVHFMLNDWAVPPMSFFGTQCPGHEGAGVVVKVGSNVTDWKVGDRAGIKPIWDVCGACETCRDGRENWCMVPMYTGLASEGTYREYLVSPAKYTSRIPEGVPDEVAAPIMCSASTMHRALLEGGFRPAEYIVFPGGGGGVGIQGVQLAKAMGMRPIVVDSGSAKRELSMKMGAEEFIDFKESKNVAEEVLKACGGVGAHGVIVTAPQAYQNALDYIGERRRATVVCVGMGTAGAYNIGADPNRFALRGLRVVGSVVGTMRDTDMALDYARRGALKMIAEVRGMSRFRESVSQLQRGEVPGRIVIDFNKE